MAGYLLLKLNKGKNSYGFLGIRNNELYTDYGMNDGAKFYSFEEAKPYINRLVKAGFEVRLWGTGDFSKDNSKFGQNPFTKIIKENKNMQEKIKKLSESIKERVLEKRLGKSEIQENSYHAEEHEGKWVIKDEAGYIMTTDKFDTKEEAEADIAKFGQPKEQILPVENARVKRVVESLDKVSKILKDRATEKGWLNLSKKEIDKKIKELQKKGWYDEYTLDMTLLYHLKDVGNTFNESKAMFGVEYRDMHTGIHKLIVAESEKKAQNILDHLKELENPPEEMEANEYSDFAYVVWGLINDLAYDVFEINYRDVDDNGMYDDIKVINYDEIKPDIYENFKSKTKKSKINEGNYDSDNAWLGFCTNVKRYANEHQVDIETAIQSEFDDLYAYADIINIWRDMPGDLGSRIGEITFLMLEDIQEGAFEDVDFISGLEESKMNEGVKVLKESIEDYESYYGYVSGVEAEIVMTGSQVKYICTPGSNDEAVESVVNDPMIKEQLAKISDEQLNNLGWWLTDYTDEEIRNMSRETKEEYLVWTAAWNIFDEETQNFEESKMNEISDRTKNRALAARDKRAKAAIDKQNRWNRHRFQEPSDEFKDVKTEEDAMAIHKTAWKETDKMWKNARRQPNMDTYKKRVRSGAISLGKDKSNVNEDNNLQQIFDDAFSGGTIPAFETANGVMYLEPQGDKIIIGGATNMGVIPQYEFEYDFSQSFDWNIQGMIELVYEQEGYPDEEWNENHKARKSMKKSVNENMSVAKAKKLYKKHGMLFLDDEEGQEAYDVLYNAGYTMKKKNDVAYCVEFDRMRESLERRKSAKKSVNEISDELANKVTSARRKELKNADRAFVKARTKVWKDTEGMNPTDRHDAILNNKKLDKAEDRARKAGRKLGNNFTLNKLRNNRKAQNESLAETLLKEAHSVLTMNENEANELTTWQFTARGFSKAMIEKQSVFGSANVRCIVHENADGKVVGTAVVDYYMNETQVEEAIKKALAENGFRATAITELVNLY